MTKYKRKIYPGGKKNLCGHENNPYKAKGLCTSCYKKILYKKNWAKSRETEKRSKRKLREEMIVAYGGRCSCCGETQYEFLQIHHIQESGVEERKRLKTGNHNKIIAHLRKMNWPKDSHTILCANCNLSLGSYGYCPHGNL